MGGDRDTWTTDALERGDDDSVRRRVAEDPAYLESRDFVDDTPLLAAIGFDRVELVRSLLDAGADPNPSVNDGYTCLLSACESSAPESLEIVRLLIAAGADIGAAGTNGYTPLHMAAAHGSTGKLRLLIAAGAEVDRRTEIDGRSTALMEAARAGHPEAVRVLLEHGADPTLEDEVQGHAPAELARAAAAGADPEVVRTLTGIDGIVPSTVEAYARAADELARTGDHAGVLRVLGE